MLVSDNESRGIFLSFLVEFDKFIMEESVELDCSDTLS